MSGNKVLSTSPGLTCPNLQFLAPKRKKKKVKNEGEENRALSLQIS